MDEDKYRDCYDVAMDLLDQGKLCCVFSVWAYGEPAVYTVPVDRTPEMLGWGAQHMGGAMVGMMVGAKRSMANIEGVEPVTL